MKSYTVKDLMVPLSEYATAREGTTLFDAIMALEKAQEEFDHTKYRHRAVLVLNKDNRVIGKLSQLDVLRALEPERKNKNHIKELSHFGFSSAYLWNLRKEQRSQSITLMNLCSKAGKIKVEDIMQAPTEGEYVDQSAAIDIAIQQLVYGNHMSLLVTRGKEIVGILLLTDVFAAVFHAMKECEINPEKDIS
jgi:CBS domain-containing protein